MGTINMVTASGTPLTGALNSNLENTSRLMRIMITKIQMVPMPLSPDTNTGNRPDALVFPATLNLPFYLQESVGYRPRGRDISVFAASGHNGQPASIGGSPGLPLAAGLTPAGLPAAIGFDGPMGSDRKLLDIGIARYDVDENWGRESFGSDFGVINGIAVDSQDRVYIANRKPEPRVLVFDPDGQFLASWGEDIFLKVGGIHGIKINREDEVFITDIEDHLVHQFTTDGKLVLSLGRRGQVGPTDMPFNRPTMAASNPGGDIFVSDGYGQFRIHRFSRNGDHICSWGSEGTGTGEFALPHGINVDPLDRVLVADRENARVQIFDQDG